MLRLDGTYRLGIREREVVANLEAWMALGVVWASLDQTMYSPEGRCVCLRDRHTQRERRDATAHCKRLHRLARKWYLHVHGPKWRLALLDL